MGWRKIVIPLASLILAALLVLTGWWMQRQQSDREASRVLAAHGLSAQSVKLERQQGAYRYELYELEHSGERLIGIVTLHRKSLWKWTIVGDTSVPADGNRLVFQSAGSAAAKEGTSGSALKGKAPLAWGGYVNKTGISGVKLLIGSFKTVVPDVVHKAKDGTIYFLYVPGSEVSDDLGDSDVQVLGVQ